MLEHRGNLDLKCCDHAGLDTQWKTGPKQDMGKNKKTCGWTLRKNGRKIPNKVQDWPELPFLQYFLIIFVAGGNFPFCSGGHISAFWLSACFPVCTSHA